MRVASRACAIGCLAVGVVAAWPAAAAMTIGMRDELGHTRTFYRDGSRIRIANPGGTDDGEAQIIDLNTTERIVVYDDARAYYDYNKTIAKVRAAVAQYEKTRPPEKKKPAPTVSYRSLGEVRRVSGLACATYERLTDGKPDAEICFAPWGGEVGAREDFFWLDELIERMATDLSAHRLPRHLHMLAKEEGLVLWVSEVNHDGSRSTMEIVKLSRDPVPAAMLNVPSDYKEFSRELTASEHPKIGPPPMDDGRSRRMPPSLRHDSGVFALLLAVALIIGVSISAAFIHLAACVVLEQPRFTQALVAAVILSGVGIVVEWIRLPPPIDLALDAFVVFAVLKISYGASTLRTLALCCVPVLFLAAVTFLGHGCAG